MIGRWLGGGSVERTYVALNAIAPTLPAAVIASEDSRFCQHKGVDWSALGAVMEDADEGGPNRGASTIAMQVAKNLFLWPGRSYIRKGMEIPIALVIDRVWSKRRMIEIYLNIAEWGDGVFGAEAAAQRHFRKRAADLSTREAALLASALPNPFRRNPAKPSRWQSRYAGTILARIPDTPTACVNASRGG